MADENNPAVESLRAEQEAQRKEERETTADQKLEKALKGTFPASDPVAEQASTTVGTSRSEAHSAASERIARAAPEDVSDLKRLLVEEIRARPLRALGWAVAAGAVLGFWAAR